MDTWFLKRKVHMRQEYREAIRDQRVIRIIGEMKVDRVTEYFKQLEELLKRKETHGKKVFVLVSSRGGEVDPSMVLYEELRSLDGLVELYTVAKGSIMSSGFNPFLAAPLQRRLATSGTAFYLHELTRNFEVKFCGSLEQQQRELREHEAVLKSLEQSAELILDVLARETGQDREKFKKLQSDVTTFGVQKALELGIIGAVME